MKNSSYGKSIQRYLELNSVPKIGDRYVDFAMNNQFGEKVQISDFDGEIVLLDFRTTKPESQQNKLQDAKQDLSMDFESLLGLLGLMALRI